MKKNLRYLFVIIVFSYCFYTIHAQKITASYTNTSLTKVLESISQQYHVKIAFDTQLADKIKVNQTISQTSINEAITKLLANSGLKSQRMGDVYMVIPDVNPEKPKPDVSAIIQKQIEKVKKYIIGIVKDKLTGETLPFAGIYFKNNQIGTTANADGFFKLELHDEDSVYLLVSFLGYEPLTIKAKASSRPTLLNVMLNSQMEQLQAIVVRSRIEVFENRSTQPGVIKFCPSKLGNIPAITELDISTPLQMLPGISGCSENAGGFSIRKAPSDKTLMVYDGFTLYHMNHFFGSFSSINTKAVKDIQVYKIPDEAHFGGSTAGIIEITGKSGNMQHVSVNAGVDMLAADIEAEIPIVKDKCSFLFASRRSFTDQVRTPLYNAMFENARYEYLSYYRKPPVAFTTNTDDPQYYFGDFNTKLTINTSAKSNLSISAFGSKDDLSFSQTLQYPKISENTNWGTKGASIRWAGDISPKWNTEFVTGFSNTTFNYDFNDSIQKFRKRLLRTVEYMVTKETNIELWLKNFSVQTNNKIQLSEKQSINLGASIQSVNSHYGLNTVSNVNANNLVDTSKIYQNRARISAMSMQYEWKGEKISIRPGLRLSRYSALKKNYPELRASLFYKPISKAILKLEMGNYYQFVNKVDFVRNGDFRSAWILSDGKKYPVTSSRNISIGINYNITTSLNIDVDAYYNQLFDLMSSQAIYKLSNSNNPKISGLNWIYDSKVKGMDIMLKQSWNYYQIWLSYTLSQAENTMKKGKTTTSYIADNDQLHEFKALQLFNFKNLSVSWSNIIGSGIVWDEYMMDNNLQLSPDYVKNSGTAPVYYRMDAGANYTLKLGKTNLKAGINLFNILNRKNVVNKFEKLSETPLADINQGINPLEETTVYGLGFAYNFFVNISF